MRITAKPRDAIRSRLIAAWRDTVDELAPLYPDLPASEVETLRDIDWTGARSQFFEGNLDIAALDDSEDLTWPVAVLRVTGSRNEGTTKFREFSGTVAVVLEVVLQWQGQAIPAAVALRTADLVVDVMYQLFHNYAWVGSLSSDGITYGGDCEVSIGPMEQNDDWRQAVTGEFSFGVDL